MNSPSTFVHRIIPPATDSWGTALRIGAVAYMLSRLFVIMGAAIAVAADAVWARLNNEEPPGPPVNT